MRQRPSLHSVPVSPPPDPTSRTAAFLEAARENPALASACSESLSPRARQEFIAALMAPRPLLKPLRKAVPRQTPMTELSIQLGAYARLTRR